MTTTTLPSLKERALTVRQLFLDNQDAGGALPKRMTVERMLRVAFTCISTTPKLLDCHPRSLMAAVMQCAQLGLEPGILGHAYLIPFENRRKGIVEVQIMPGYRGLLKLARNTGEVSTVFAECVYRGDKFTYQRGTDPKIDHVPDPNEDVKKRGAYPLLRRDADEGRWRGLRGHDPAGDRATPRQVFAGG